MTSPAPSRSSASAAPSRHEDSGAPPAPWRSTQSQREAAVLTVIGAGALAVIGLWIGDTPGRSLHTFADRLTAAGRITGLLGTYLILVQVVLMARLPWLDRSVGTDRMSAWHRSNGQYTIGLLAAHTVLVTWGYAVFDHFSFAHEAKKLIRSYPDVLAATVALGALILVGITSARIARRRLRYETWYFIHLYTYIAIALSFSHQLATGNDFVTHPANRALWGAMYVITFGLLLVYRVAVPFRNYFRYRLRVSAVVPEGPDAVSVWVSGRNLQQMGAQAGQFFRWRFLDRQSWWEAHPFSLSLAPSAPVLRITAKDVGDHTDSLRQLRIGTRVMAEGPYGNLTVRRRTRRRVLLIAGGVGITPLRAMIDELSADADDLTLLYRASRERDLLFRSELEKLASARKIEVRYLLGRRQKKADPLSARQLRHYVPDVADRDVYLCGPPGMMDLVVKCLRSLGVSRSQIHQERFEL